MKSVKPQEITVHCEPAEDVMRVTIGKRPPKLVHLSSPMTPDALLNGARLARDEAVVELVSTNRLNHAEIEILKRRAHRQWGLVSDFAALYEELRAEKASARRINKLVREFIKFYFET